MTTQSSTHQRMSKSKKDNQLTPFEEELRLNIEKAKAKLRSDGVTSVSVDNLRQCTLTPAATGGAPVGANAPQTYKLLFAQLCDTDKEMIEF